MTARRPIGILRVFVDTSAFFALLDERDASHAAAVSILARLAAEPSQLLTTNLILAECHALILARLGRRPALRFLDDVRESSTNVIRGSVADEQSAVAILRRYDDKDFSFTDASCFAVIERLKLTAAFSFDRNFAQYGLTVLQS